MSPVYEANRVMSAQSRAARALSSSKGFVLLPRRVNSETGQPDQRYQRQIAHFFRACGHVIMSS